MQGLAVSQSSGCQLTLLPYTNGSFDLSLYEAMLRKRLAVLKRAVVDDGRFDNLREVTAFRVERGVDCRLMVLLGSSSDSGKVRQQ